MELKPGAKLGAYEIISLLGKGGMGEVWKAHDPQIGRDVAIKVSAQQFTDRFEREVRAIGALNHPNICTLYHVGPNYLVMELVEGPTLAERIKEGPIPLDEALGIGKQIADALEAAHEKSIVHRDLKPANVKIRPDGSVKVLDFGLAKAGETQEVTPDSPTMMPGTQIGMILGTAGYMSPEQARGKEVDKRADIWAFGVVLYEMVTGKRLFEGETVSDTLAAVLRAEPDLTLAPEKTRRLLRACLQKDPKQRLQAIGDWKLLLEEQAEGPAATGRGRLPWIAAGAFALIAAALAFVHFRERPPIAEVTRFQILLPANESLPAFAPPEVSPDGRKLAFVTVGAEGSRLWIRSFDSLDARPLVGVASDGFVPFFWSSDSRFLAFLSPDHKLKKVDVSGGPAQTLCDAANLLGGSWSKDGTIIFAEGGQSGVKRVSQAGGTPTALTAPDPTRQERGHLFPKLLPDGRHFLYFRDSTTLANRAIYVGAIDAKPSQQSSKPLLANEGLTMASYVSSGNSGTGRSSNGYLLFGREGTVLAQAFDPGKLELSGDPVPVVDQVGSAQNIVFFSASANGVLGYVGGGSAGSAELTWFDRQGKNLGPVGEPGRFSSLALSPDGKQAAVSRFDAQGASSFNLWLYDLTRGGSPARFTFAASKDDDPVFSPDGSSIVFESNRDGLRNLYRRLTNGAKDEELLLKSDEQKYPHSWSRNGNYLLYSIESPKAKLAVWILLMDGSRKRIPFQATEFNETAASFSPDGRWVAYQSDESGRYEIYVREFSLGSDGRPEATAPHLISSDGGVDPHWRDDGKELIYASLDQRTMLSADIVSLKPVFQFSPPKVLFQLPSVPGIPPAVAADGKRFLAAVPVVQSGPQQFTVVQNWQAGLRK
jgi:eukaryotic-like serine/threonine-protein kinase